MAHNSAHTTAEAAPFDHVVTDPAQLDDLYRAPSQRVLDKVTDHLDDGTRDFLAASTFCLLGTSDGAGRHDVSPKGGPAGFVRVLDRRHLALPDLNGNNRLDSIRNLVVSPTIGLLFLVPGMGEMLRINGRAWVSTDPELLDGFTDQLRRPATAIAVRADEVYLHCAKAIRRGGLWDPTAWPGADEVPSAAGIFLGHLGATGTVDEAEVTAGLEQSYRDDLAADLP